MYPETIPNKNSATDTLINQFCSVIPIWAKEATDHELNIIEWAMLDSGGIRHVEREGRVENPHDPIHQGKSVAEVEGRYTLAQLREHLHFLVSRLGVAEYVLIPGLVKSIEAHLLHLAVDYNEKRQSNLEQADRFEDMANNPQNYQEYMDNLTKHLIQSRSERGQDDELVTIDDAINALRTMATTLRKAAENPDDNEVERKYRIEVWQRLTDPFLEYKTLQKAIYRHLDINEE